MVSASYFEIYLIITILRGVRREFSSETSTSKITRPREKPSITFFSAELKLSKEPCQFNIAESMNFNFIQAGRKFREFTPKTDSYVRVNYAPGEN